MKELNNKSILYCIIVLLYASLPGFADDMVQWRLWNAQDNLGESWTKKINQCNDGSILLNHGHVEKSTIIKDYAVENIPSPGHWVAIIDDSSGNLWSLLWDDTNKFIIGFQKFSDSKWIPYPDNNIEIDKKEKSDLPFVPIGNNQVLYLQNNHIYLYDADTKSATLIQSDAPESLGEIHEIHMTPDDAIWILGSNGIAKANLTDLTLNRIALHVYLLDQSSGLSGLHHLIINGSNNFFVVGADNKDKSVLLQFDQDAWSVVYHEDGEIIEYGWQTPDHSIWLIKDTAFTQIKDYPFNHEMPFELKTIAKPLINSKDGTFWVTTDNGVLKWSPPLWQKNDHFSSLKNEISNIHEDAKHNIWFLAKDKLFRLQNNRFSEYLAPENYHFYNSIASLSDNQLAVVVVDNDSEVKRLCLYDTDKEDISYHFASIPKNKNILKIFPEENGLVWIENDADSTYQHSVFYGEDFKPLINDAFSGKFLRMRYVLSLGNQQYWICSTEGVAFHDNGTNRVFTEEDGYLGKDTMTALKIDDYNIWIGGIGIIQQYNGDKWTTIHNCPAKERIISMIKDSQDRIWVASGKNLYRYYKNSWITHSTDEGLPSKLITQIFEDSSNRLWALAGGSVYQYHPEADPYPPQTYIPPEINAELALPGGEVHFSFTGKDQWKYTRDERILYSYRFNNRPWSSYSSDKIATATGLEVGAHHLEVKAIDRNGNMDPSPAIFSFSIPPIPLQNRVWFWPVTILIFLTVCTSAIIALSARIKLAKYASGLESIVNKRTAEIQQANKKLQQDMIDLEELQDQLRQSQKMEAIGKLAGGISHDFNNLILAIIGHSDFILMEENLTPQTRDDVEQIIKASQRARSLTRQLLAFSRKQVLQPKLISLNEYIEDMEKMLQRLIGEDVNLITRLSSVGGIVKADPGQIEQVILNLAVNARDAMPTGGKLIIETANVTLDQKYTKHHQDLNPGDYVTISVSDTGVGIDKDIQERIYEPFFTTKELSKGTGLGLSTVYGIVKQSGGCIWLYSEMGEGTTFKLYFPRVYDKPNATIEQNVTIESLQGSETILLVEDEELVRNITIKTLNKYGYTVHESRDGNQALKIYDQLDGSIDLIITDVIMPGMSGKELSDHILAKNKNTKVLFISGYTDDLIAKHGILEEGMNLLQKPFTHKEIATTIRQILNA
jgi:signal transduction histidine kinase/ligand-binding sensor domain-containing protein